MNTYSESKQFVACITCGGVVMRIQAPMKKKKKFTSDNKHRLSLTLCRTHDSEDKIKKRSAWDNSGVDVFVNRHMLLRRHTRI